MTAQNVLITPGGQAALSAAFRHLCAPGDPVIVESPTYVGALAVARAAGLSMVPVPGDRDGVLPDVLADALARTGARLVYLQPRYANPAGAVLAPDRREAVLAAVRAARRVPDRGRLDARLRPRAAVTAAAGQHGRRRARDLPALAVQAGGAGDAGGRPGRARAGAGQAAARPDQRRPVRRARAAAGRARRADRARLGPAPGQHQAGAAGAPGRAGRRHGRAAARVRAAARPGRRGAPVAAAAGSLLRHRRR